MFLTYERENVQKQQAIISMVNSDKIIKIPDGVKTSNPSLFKNGVTSFFLPCRNKVQSACNTMAGMSTA